MSCSKSAFRVSVLTPSRQLATSSAKSRPARPWASMILGTLPWRFKASRYCRYKVSKRVRSFGVMVHLRVGNPPPLPPVGCAVRVSGSEGRSVQAALPRSGFVQRTAGTDGLFRRPQLIGEGLCIYGRKSWSLEPSIVEAVSAVQFGSQLEQKATVLALVTARCVESGVGGLFSRPSVRVLWILRALSIYPRSIPQNGLSVVFAKNVALICSTA